LLERSRSPEAAAPTPFEAAMIRAEWQHQLFGRVSRAELLALTPAWPCHSVTVRVHRNHGFDAVASAANCYAGWNRMRFEFVAHGYDDSLSFAYAGDTSLDLIFLDTARIRGLAGAELGSWLRARIEVLRSRTTSPILVLAWPLPEVARAELVAAPIPGVHVPDLDAIANAMGDYWISARTGALTGSRLSNAACLRLALELGCRWLPACLCPPVKAIAVDLDDTLYRGVLAEDGALALQLAEGHRRLQLELADLARCGIFLVLVSRNDPKDVEELFRVRADFPLRLEDFAVIEVSWGSKAEAIARAAATLRIGVDSVVFVDDNPGELGAVASALPVTTVHAGADPEITARALAGVGGLFRWQRLHEDAVRTRDMAASRTRDGLASQVASPMDYLKDLRVELEYLVDPRNELARIHELGMKTNQFTLALRRFSEAELARRLDDGCSRIVAVRLTDRLSASGIVAMVVGRVEGEELHIDEICVSCRALGRHLEDVMLGRAIRLVGEGHAVTRLVVPIRVGPRNQPARAWLSQFLAVAVPDGDGEVTVPYGRVQVRPAESAVQTKVLR
jgi:FkbH-like protein